MQELRESGKPPNSEILKIIINSQKAQQELDIIHANMGFIPIQEDQ